MTSTTGSTWLIWLKEKPTSGAAGDYLHSVAFWPPSHLINYVPWCQRRLQILRVASELQEFWNINHMHLYVLNTCIFWYVAKMCILKHMLKQDSRQRSANVANVEDVFRIVTMLHHSPCELELWTTAYFSWSQEMRIPTWCSWGYKQAQPLDFKLTLVGICIYL